MNLDAERDHHETRQDLAETLRQLRAGAGLSMAEVGRRADLSASTIDRHETGTGKPPCRETVRRLFTALLDDPDAVETVASVYDAATVEARRAANVLTNALGRSVLPSRVVEAGEEMRGRAEDEVRRLRDRMEHRGNR